ncbi:HAMP domain-containing protein [Polymorphobacter fuscus]|uniref:histidine kinase n=2 Tax=Sandarakinorhabdus fusca TaxID=1439888 RepID=A0A7C9GPF1_9SPHN|nr:HAMP domain-containing sensor histidine kinase [Polymorphobacter fuscus]KAB7648001.1 HAMP domain-containing histidine kinase [Polymorphobacter fuscus]MQT16896.1 HAMP domain-containing protein [Polymorphobacter fuscus]
MTGGVLLLARNAIVQQSARDRQEIVAEVANDLRAWHARGGDAALATEITSRLDTLRGENLVLLLTAADGRVIAGNLAAWPPVVARTTNWQTIDLFRTGADRAERLGISATTLPGGSHLLTGHVIESDVRYAQVSQRVLIAAFLFTVPLALIVAAAMTRAINRRVAGIADTASAVAEGDLARRVPLDGSGDSFDRLGDGVNAMLARIQTLVEELRIVTGSLAHDLRGPIFRLTATLEEARNATDDPVATAAMERVSVEAAALQTMLATAMQIAQAEAGIGRDRFGDVDVAAMLGDIGELYGPAAEDRGITLVVTPFEGHFRLHRELVSQAIGNVIDNAMRHAAGATRITVSAILSEAALTISVADNGVGIAVADRATALRRFGRLDPSRHAPGAGLGLSLVEAVAHLHDGNLALGDNAPGLRVEMTLRTQG